MPTTTLVGSVLDAIVSAMRWANGLRRRRSASGLSSGASPKYPDGDGGSETVSATSICSSGGTRRLLLNPNMCSAFYLGRTGSPFDERSHLASHRAVHHGRHDRTEDVP